MGAIQITETGLLQPCHWLVLSVGSFWTRKSSFAPHSRSITGIFPLANRVAPAIPSLSYSLPCIDLPKIIINQGNNHQDRTLVRMQIPKERNLNKMSVRSPSMHSRTGQLLSREGRQRSGEMACVGAQSLIDAGSGWQAQRSFVDLSKQSQK